MTLATTPILNHGPSVYISGWDKPATPASRRAGSIEDNSRIVDEIIVPILDCEDVATAFPEKWTDFKEWRDSVADALAANTPSDLVTLLKREDATEEKLRAIFIEAMDRFGEAWVKPLLGGLNLRKIVRDSVLPHLDSWPEDSYDTIADRMALNELCLACVLHHLITGTGRETNARTLSMWSYHYADYAYAEAGFSGKDFTPGDRLERK